MSINKLGANAGDRNFIRKCAEGGNDWSVQRIAAHLGIKQSIVQEFYVHYCGTESTPEYEIPDQEPPKKPKKAKKATAEEDFS